MDLSKSDEESDRNSLKNGKSENEYQDGISLDSKQHSENKILEIQSRKEKESEIVRINEDNVEKRKSEIKDADILIINNGKQIKDAGEGSTVKNIIAKCRESDDEDAVPPALPPRPPPRPRQLSPCTCSCDCGIDEGGLRQRLSRRPPRSCWANGLRKYVFLCTACGSLSIMLGALFLTVYFMLKSYTSSLDHFETIPTYVPSGMLIATGCLITCLACRKNRNSFLMKLCGLCSLCCAILCVAVTVTTTVIHMNRLQTLRECLYTQKTQSCTCYSGLTGLTDNDRTSEEGIKFVFNSTRDCEVIHGALYSCLRAIFGLSVIGILICIFSCMLIYQLLSHEKKKMYWAQLEMRCRYLYRQQRNPHYCSCCDECRYPPPPHELFPWELMGNRFWSAGRIGNLYTPNPEDRGNQNRLRSGWNWRRLPWSRGANAAEPPRGNLGSPDSQYGFNSGATAEGTPYTVIDPRAQTVISGCHTGLPPDDVTEGGFYSWGPPPPYASNRNSANNSPARRSLGDILHQVSPIRRNDNVSPARPFHHVLHHHHLHHPLSMDRQCSTSTSRQATNVNNPARPDSLQKTTPSRISLASDALQQQRSDPETVTSGSLSSVHRQQKILRDKDDYENACESENFPSTDGFNTLPSSKKRNQTRIGDLFQKETTTGYYFSSAENLGCADSNVRNENFPPRVYLTNDANSARQGFEDSRDRRESGLSETSKGVKSSENDLFGKKEFLTNRSPTRQRQRNETESQTLPREKKDVPGQMYRKKFKKKPGPGIESENGNDNVTPSHYRMGMVRSPTVQNFNRIVEKSLKAEADEETGDKSLEIENNKVLKNLKFMSKDAELLEKHGSLMREFNKSMDLQKNFRLKKEKSFNGIDNEGFQNLDETSGKSRPTKNCQQDLKRVTIGEVESSEGRAGRSYPKTEEIGNSEESKANENESDVYFGDVSNSSCYASVQNDGVDSCLYEEASERRNGRSLLSKQNLKLMEDETSGYKRCQNESEDARQNRRQRNFPPNNRYRRSPDVESESAGKSDSERRDDRSKNRRRQILRPPLYDEAVENDGNYLNRISGRAFRDRFRSDYPYRETIRSNDDQSSGSLTADSGISSGMSFVRRNFENLYQEIDLERKEENETRKPDSGFETLTLNERFGKNEKYQSFSTKVTNLDNVDFSHPLFQKPKIVPRGGNRFKDPDPRPNREGTPSKPERGNDSDFETQKVRTNYFNHLKRKTPEGSEEVTDQLSNSYNLNFASDSESFSAGNGTSSGTENQSKRQIENGQKSPIQLPRFRAAGKSPLENLGCNRHLNYVKTNNEKVGSHFLAPDAQYEYQENYNSEPKQKSQVMKSGQNLPKTKPVVPARPLNLQNVSQHRNRSPKVDNINVQMMRSVSENYCKTENTSGSQSRRRQQLALDDPNDKDNLKIDNISVNV